MYLGVFPFLPTDKRFAARFREADRKMPCPNKKGSVRSSSRSRRLDVALELAEFKEGVANSDTVPLTGPTIRTRSHAVKKIEGAFVDNFFLM